MSPVSLRRWSVSRTFPTGCSGEAAVEAALHLKSGDVTIIGQGAATDAPYVQSLSINGHAWNKPWIRFADISHGASLDYTLSNVANHTWGARQSDTPPSYSFQK